MKGVFIKMKEGHRIDGDGEYIGEDRFGEKYSFTRSSGHMEVPIDVAVRLEREKPQRYEMVDRNLAKELMPNIEIKDPKDDATDEKVDDQDNKSEEEVAKEEESTLDDVVDDKKEEPKQSLKTKPIEKKTPEPPVVEEMITLVELKKMSKDQMNDWAAKRDYDVKASWLKDKIISRLVKQIEKRTGIKVKNK